MKIFQEKELKNKLNLIHGKPYFIMIIKYKIPAFVDLKKIKYFLSLNKTGKYIMFMNLNINLI